MSEQPQAGPGEEPEGELSPDSIASDPPQDDDAQGDEDGDQVQA